MVRATRTRRREVISLPLRTVLASLRKKLLGFVHQREAELLTRVLHAPTLENLMKKATAERVIQGLVLLQER